MGFCRDGDSNDRSRDTEFRGGATAGHDIRHYAALVAGRGMERRGAAIYDFADGRSVVSLYRQYRAYYPRFDDRGFAL